MWEAIALLVQLSIYDIQGNQRYFEEAQLDDLNRTIEVVTADYPAGNYIHKISHNRKCGNFKIHQAMKTNRILLLVVAALTLLGCKDPIPDPEQTVLILPEDNTSCLYVSQSSSTASVDFSWQEAQFTDEYLVVVKNLTTEEANHF